MVKNFDHLAKLKYSPVNPTAFTERGLYMLATILKGSVATQTTINIINTFVEIRELSRAIARVPEVVDENEKKSLLKRSGEIISNILASDSTSLESETEIELNFAFSRRCTFNANPRIFPQKTPFLPILRNFLRLSSFDTRRMYLCGQKHSFQEA